MSDDNPATNGSTPDLTDDQTPLSTEAPTEKALADDDIKNHPLYKAEEERAAKAERELVGYKGRLEKARKGILDEDESPDEKKESPETESNFVTRDELWTRDNKDRIDLVGEEDFQKILDEEFEGNTKFRNQALELAEKRNNIDTESHAHRQRRDNMSVPSTTSRETTSDVTLTEDDIRVGLTLDRKKELAERYG